MNSVEFAKQVIKWDKIYSEEMRQLALDYLELSHFVAGKTKELKDELDQIKQRSHFASVRGTHRGEV